MTHPTHLGFKLFFGVYAFYHIGVSIRSIDQRDTIIHMLERIHNQKKLT
jgi:hypothetical protein